MNNQKIPNGLYKCEICGEYKGKVMEKDLNWNDSFDRENKEKSNEYLTVSCLCDGILYSKCKKNKIHRPISNYYDTKKNKIRHVSYFGGMIPCKECRIDNTNILKQFQNIKWGISKDEYKKLFSKKTFVNYYPEEENAITFVEVKDNIYVSVSAFFILENNVHGLVSINLVFYNPDYKRLDDKTSEKLFEQNKKELTSIYGDPIYINENIPAEFYMSKFISWETKNLQIALNLQLSKDYNSLVWSDNILSDISTISVHPSVSINIVNKFKEEKINNYIKNQSFKMKKSQHDKLERELEKFYIPMFRKTMGCNFEEAKKIFDDVLNRAKEISKNGVTKNLPTNYGDVIIKEELTNETIKLYLSKKRIEGVIDEDIKRWWNSSDLERSMMLAVDENIKMATVDGLVEKKGLSEEEAWDKIPKYCPIFGDPNDSNSKYNPLPLELKNRINIYIEKRNKTNPEQFMKEIDGSPTFNFLIRKEIKKNNL